MRQSAFCRKKPNKSKDLLNSISQATIQKMKQLSNEKILLIQDTTELSFGYRDGIENNNKRYDTESCNVRRTKTGTKRWNAWCVFGLEGT